MMLPRPSSFLLGAGFLFIAGAFMLGTQGCQRQNWDTNPEHMLRLSTDTLFFDTVFATVGSVTLPLKLYNDHDASLRVEDLQLADGSSSAYRLNVNGWPVQDLDTPLETLSLLPGDSMYVFVEVTVDPNSGAGATPFWVRDELTFVTNGNVQEVKLLARGQNAVFHGGPNQYTTLACDEVWTAELPHVIYGRILVDPGCTLTILPGAEVYAHDGSGIWVRGGTLVADGSLGAPILFRGDRLEDNYATTPGQWGLSFEITDTLSGSLVNFSAFRGGIWLDRAVNCVLDHVDLRQATVGVWVDSVGTDADHALRLTNSVLSNMESIGLLSQSGHIEGYNNLISNCGQACGYFALGGNIQLHLSTFANFSTQGSGLRQFPTVYVNDWYEAANGSVQVRPFAATTEFRNCIVAGNNASLNEFSEFIVDLWDSSMYPSPLWTASAVQHQMEAFPANILDDATSVNSDPPFVNVFEEDFRLETSAASWTGISSSPPFSVFEVGTDLAGEPRSTFAPTKGCYERIN